MNVPEDPNTPEIEEESEQVGTDVPIGGDLMLYAGAEYSFPIVANSVRGVVFIDSGTVESNYSITTWRASVGTGLRILIPYFGPVPMSFDFAFPISEDDADETEVFSFTFGWVF